MITPSHLSSALRDRNDQSSSSSSSLSSSSSSSSSQVNEDVLELGELVYSSKDQEARLQGAFSGHGVARYRFLGIDIEPLTLIFENNEDYNNK